MQEEINRIMNLLRLETSSESYTNASKFNVEEVRTFNKSHQECTIRSVSHSKYFTDALFLNLNCTTHAATYFRHETHSGITGGSEYVGKGGTGGDGDTAGTGSIEPGGSVKLSLFFDIW